MNKIFNRIRIVLMLLILGGQLVSAQKIAIYADKPEFEISPYLYGLFFEDINYAADGGLYAELIQNRSFEYYPVYSKYNETGHLLTPMYAWTEKYIGGAEGHVYVSRSLPLNQNNVNNLEMLITNSNGFVGISNSGFDGIPLTKGEKYNFSFFCAIQNAGFEPEYTQKQIKVLLEDENGIVLDSASWENDQLKNDWTKYSYSFIPGESTQNGKLTILVHGRSELKIDMVSLMPENTYLNRKNGLRADLVEVIKDLKPTFLRFPGGCIVHGSGMENAYNWKETIGDVATRKPKWNLWAYHQSFGLGYFEYFQLCEDLGAIPLPVVPVGVSCGWMKYECVPMEDIDVAIQDALDLVEFANGAVDTHWGKIRVEMGHPEPFNLEYICLGNEEEDTPELLERFPKFVEAFKEKYPEIKLIGTSSPGNDVPLYDEMSKMGCWSSDEHCYEQPQWYIDNQDRFDNWDRTKAKVMVGEYASMGNKLFNALGEAAYLTGVERNADLVEMTCYAPLLARYGNTQWDKANLIYFNDEKIVLTPNYFVQQMFAQNKGDVYLKNVTEDWPGKELAVSSTLDKGNNEIILKVVNAKDKSFTLQVDLNDLKQISKSGKLTLLKGVSTDENTLDNPDRVKPEKRTINVDKQFNLEVPAYSVQILRIAIKK
ncbi:alpha-L-arabinofuranosidase C-terminal domain-containing protein [uncultured Draconibacterium sp.]|uniref:alpha-L-arabinofuranosidase C-terminal domain-containing protein n=1 Tax=uncultured Draconibacterium sp. TaxID=1573823 RepID=UPI0032180070